MNSYLTIGIRNGGVQVTAAIWFGVDLSTWHCTIWISINLVCLDTVTAGYGIFITVADHF